MGEWKRGPGGEKEREKSAKQVMQIAEDEYRKRTFKNNNTDTHNSNIKVLSKFGNFV